MITSKCENCLSRNVCRWYENGTGKNLCCSDGFICPEQKDKDRFIKVPCKIGTHLWRVTTPYRKQPKVTEYIVKNFKTIGKKHNLQIEVQALNVPMTNWMYYNDFYATKEEAEKEMRNDEE